MLFCATRHVVGYEALVNESYIVIKAYKFTVIEIFFVLSYYCVFVLSQHIESTESMIFA